MTTAADPNPFRLPLLARVTLPGERGQGVVVARAQRVGAPARYTLHFLNGKGRQQKVSLSEPQLIDGANGTAGKPRAARSSKPVAKRRRNGKH